MRYILDNEGYVELCSKTHIECNGRGCTEYTGIIPAGYNSLEEWAANANIRAYKVVDGNLVYDFARDEALQEIYNKEAEDHKPLCKNDLYEVDEKINQNDTSLKEQYTTNLAYGRIARTSNAMPLSPNIKVKDISCYAYDKIKLIASNKNLLPNTATSKTISGVRFKQNTDRSITVNGASAEAIEYDIAGSSINTSPIFVFKKDFNYYLSSNGYQIKFYYYDGTNRTEVYSSAGGKISFDTDKKVTNIVLYIPSGTTVNTTIYPQLELNGTSSYIAHEEFSLEIDYSSLVDEALYPSDTLYPSDDLFPMGTTIDYMQVSNNSIYASKNGAVRYLKEGFLSALKDTNFIYSTEDNFLEVTYYTNVLKVDDLGFLQGKATTTNQFKILKDGSIEAHNGYFSGTIEVTGGSMSGVSVDGYVDNKTLENNYVNNEKLANDYSSNYQLMTEGKTIINGANIMTGTVTAAKVSADIITTNNFSAQNINANKITSGTISTDRLEGKVITTDNFSAQKINADNITSGTISTDRLSTNVITTSNFSAQNINANKISSGTVSSASIDLYNGVGFLKMSLGDTYHPYVSALNVATQGASSNLGGVSFRNVTGRYARGDEVARIACTGNGAFYQIANGTANYSSGGATGIDSGSYMRISSGNSGAAGTYSGSTYITANASITLSASSGAVYAAGNSLASARVQTVNGSASSKNTKENFVEFDNDKYENSLKLLEDMKMYEYDYKYDLYKDKHQYGFIIDEIEELDKEQEFFKIHEEEAIVNGKHLNFNAEEKSDTDEVIKVKMYDSNTLDKYLLTVCKALLNKVETLENKIKELESDNNG
jgi:hypothetical protein